MPRRSTKASAKSTTAASTEDAGMTRRGKVDLLDEVRRADEAVRRLAEPEREEGPGQQAGEREQRIRKPVRADVREPPEEDREDDHRQQRLQNGPGDAEQRLLVAHLDVAPDQEVEQLAIGPDVLQPEGAPALLGLDQDVGNRCGCGQLRRHVTSPASAASSPCSVRGRVRIPSRDRHRGHDNRVRARRASGRRASARHRPARAGSCRGSGAPPTISATSRGQLVHRRPRASPDVVRGPARARPAPRPPGGSRPTASATNVKSRDCSPVP